MAIEGFWGVFVEGLIGGFKDKGLIAVERFMQAKAQRVGFFVEMGITEFFSRFEGFTRACELLGSNLREA